MAIFRLIGEGARLTLWSGRTMKVSVLITGSAVALISTCILTGSVASAAISTESKQQYRPKKAAGKNREQSEASTVKACLAADPPRTWAEASQGGGTIELREAAR